VPDAAASKPGVKYKFGVQFGTQPPAAKPAKPAEKTEKDGQ
jgi:hypothetical protein